MIATARVTVTTSAARLDVPHNARRATIRNLDASATVYYGGSTVTADATTTGGFPILAGETQSFNTGDEANVYLIVASSTAAVAVLFEED